MGLVQRAEELGYRRFWFAEHHNMQGVASTTPPVLIAAAAARTKHIRVGSGGVMLPNHAPLIVAEQFAALEALAPGRIDLGIRRAPGSDPVITQLLRRSGTAGDVEQFPDHVQDIALMLNDDGATVRFTSGGKYTVRATPAASAAPEMWLLGSSDYSAQLAASLGLPYVFAHHFAGLGLERALDLYRTHYRPSEAHPTPRTFLTANVVAASTVEEAHDRALPQMRAMARLRMNRPLGFNETVDEALAGYTSDNNPQEQKIVEALRGRWFIGTGDTVATQIRDFAAAHAVDEVMLSPVAGSYAAEPLTDHPGRTRTLELVANALR